jgi:tellurite resistance protein TerC
MIVPIHLWIGFHALVAVLVAAEVLLTRGDKRQSTSWAIGWTCLLVAVAACFCLWIGWREGQGKALEFLSSYLVEGSLSVDNLFVFLIIFRARSLSRSQQQQALLLGIGGAMVMRAGMILLGIQLLERFQWVQYLMGAFLLYAAVRLYRQSQHLPSPVGRVAGCSNAAGAAKLLLLTIVALELTDVVFALDSIPAVLAITRDPFLAYTSNIFAILGLRSLFLVLSPSLNKLRGMHYGLALILGFVGLKMVLGNWIQIPVLLSLGIILAILCASLGISLWTQRASNPAA